MNYSRDTLTEVKKIDILDLATKLGVEIIQTGNIYQAKCIHPGDDTPSLTFYPESNTFYCFGCHATGDVIRFVSWYTGISFPKAVQRIIELYQLPVVTVPRPNLMSRNRLYWRHLDGSETAKNYLLSRSIGPDEIAKWRIGLVPEHLQYGGRMAFAIMDEQSETVGFAYRSMDDTKPKYINSSNSDIFNKSSLLYGYNFIRPMVTAGKPIVLVEGYTDVIQLQKYGIPAVSAMGISISKQQIALIKRLTDTVLVYYDDDGPGKEAMEKVVPQLRAEGLYAKMVVGGGCDPDEKAIELKEGILDFINENAYILESYRIQREIAQHKARLDDLNIKLINKTLPLLAQINNPIDLEYQIASIASTCHIDKDFIYRMLSKGGHYGQVTNRS